MTILATLDRTFLLRAVVTLAVLVAVEVAMALYRIGGGALADGAALYVAVLLGGLFAMPQRDVADLPASVLDDAPGVIAFLVAPVAVVGLTAVLLLPFSVGALDVRLGAAVLVAALAAALALIAAVELVPAETWSAPPDRNALAVVAGGVSELLRTLFLPGAVAAAGFVLGSRLLG